MISFNPRRYFADLLHVEMEKNDRIWICVGDLGFKMWDEIRRDFPNRFVNVGAAEQLLLGVGVGLALEGKQPICYSISSFLLYRPAEWIKNFLMNENIPVKLVGSGLDNDYKDDGFTHHIFQYEDILDDLRLSYFCPRKEESALQDCFVKFMAYQGPAFLGLRR
jgi:transketolase